MSDLLAVPSGEDLDLEGPQAAFSDEELAELALAADPDSPLADDAVPLPLYPEHPGGLLPTWYMPPVMARHLDGWRRNVVFMLVASFLLIDAFGLCMTYGWISAA